MYGLGIRIGFYLQWYSAIVASWIAPSEINSLRFTNSLFIAATFLALVIQTAGGNLHSSAAHIWLLSLFRAIVHLDIGDRLQSSFGSKSLATEEAGESL
jgi:hypothetical protein